VDVMIKLILKILCAIGLLIVGMVSLFVALAEKSVFYMLFAWFNIWQLNNIMQDKDNE